jgi:DnaJ-class molecular chaperone
VTLRQNPQGLEPLVSVEVRCPDCRGEGGFRWRVFDGSETGAEDGETCRTCGGSGVVAVDRRIRDGREGETDD